MIPVSPGVYHQVIDFSQYARQLSTTQLVLVGTASKGPLDTLTRVSDQIQFVDLFGEPNGMNHMQYAAMQFLRRGNNLQIIRVAASNATKSYVKVVDATYASIVTFESKTVGSFLNSYKLIIEAGTIGSTYKVTLRNPDDANGFPGSDLAVYDNLVFTLTGAPSGAVLITDAMAADSYVDVTIDNDTLTPVLQTYVFAMGDDGIADDMATEIIGTVSGNDRTGMQLLYNTDNVEFNLIAVPGVVSEPVITELKNLCVSRGDAMYIIDPPVDKGNSLGIPMMPYEIGKEGGKAEADIGTSELALLALIGGTTTGSKTVTVSDTVTRGSEKLTWTANALVIEVEAGVSTVADVMRASEYPQGTPWALVLSNSATAEVTTVTALTETAMSALPNYTAGTVYSVSTTDDQVKWHNATNPMDYDMATRKWGLSSALNNNLGAVFGWWVKYFDAYTGKYLWTAPSGHVLAVIANNDAVRYPWFAPAGFNRAILPEGLDVQYSPNQGDRDALYGGSNCFNPIVNFSNEGTTVWGQKTTQRIASAMDRINVVRMILYARKIIATAARSVIFEPNDQKTWSQLRGLINPVLRDIAAKRGLQEFKVIIDESTNTPDLIDQNRLYGKIYVKPTKTAESIELDFIVTSSGASFEEI